MVEKEPRKSGERTMQKKKKEMNGGYSRIQVGQKPNDGYHRKRKTVEE